MVSQEEIESEMNKLRKSDLIRIIITKNVPSDLNISEKVLNAINLSENRNLLCDKQQIDEMNGTNLKTDITNISLKCDLKISNQEVQSQKRLICELERTISNLETIIELMKDNKKEGTMSTVNADVAGFTEKIEIKRRNKEKSKNEVTAEEENKTTGNNSRHKESEKKQIVWGEAEDAKTVSANAKDTFAAATRRAWLYVGRVKKGTSASQISKYLEEKFENHTFIVEPLNVHKDALSTSFKIGADLTLLDELNKPTTWPKGVAIKKFMFFRPKQTKKLEQIPRCD